jgi:hypothetical protein
LLLVAIVALAAVVCAGYAELILDIRAPRSQLEGTARSVPARACRSSATTRRLASPANIKIAVDLLVVGRDRGCV